MDDEKDNNKYPKVPKKYKIEYIGRPTNEQKREKQKSYKLGYWKNLKLWWHWKGKSSFYRFILIVGIIVLVVWYANSDNGIEVKRFPLLEEPKTITFQWEYKNSPYVLTKTFYKTAYEYYNSQPKVHYCPDYGCSVGWEEEYFKMFLKEVEEDDTISQIASDIESLGRGTKLDDDQIAELTIAFVQSIPYDFEKTKVAEPLPRYPYETLYDNKGICSDKSFLAVSLIRELGYGVALLDYEYEEHIAPAIKCPKEYSSYNSGYCFAEVTELGFRIGEIPLTDIDTGIPKVRIKAEFYAELFSEERGTELNLSELKNARVYEITDGNTYQKIIETAQIIQNIETLEKELNKLKGIIILLENEVNQLESSVNYYDQQVEVAYRRHEILRDRASYNEYTRLYSQYESVYNKYESKVNGCDREIVKYNKLVEEYNTLIEDFYK